MIIPEDIVQKLSDLSIEDVAGKLGITVKRHKSLCFMHNDHSPSLTFSPKKNMYYCFVCGKGGGPIQLVMEHEGWTFQDACRWLGKEFNILWTEDKGYRKPVRKTIRRITLGKKETEETVFDGEVYQGLMEIAKPSEAAKRFLFDERHFKEDVIQQLKIKSVTYSEQAVNWLTSQFGVERCLKSGLVRKGEYGLYFYFYTPCLLFPYFELDGSLAGVQSRYLGDKKEAPRFQFMASQKTRLFNLPILNKMNRGEQLYISEGITDCLALLSTGKNAVAIPSATILPKEDLVMLKSFDLHMYPDQDEAGQKAYRELKRYFINNYTTVKAEKLPEGIKDYCNYYIKTLEADGK